MIKLIMNRFADSDQEINVNIKTKMTTTGVKEGAKEVDNATKSLEKLNKTSLSGLASKLNSMPSLINKMSKSFAKTDFTQLVNFGRMIRRTTTSVVEMVESAATYEESLNLYTMALGKYAKEASIWTNRISEKLLLDPSDVMQYTGAFYNLTKGLKVGADDAYLMSKNLTQLTYDMASYLNISNEAAYTKIQSAMAGQSRAVQSVGVAMQVASLQELAYELGIKKKVSTMTQAEKTYLRYIQLMRSTEQMQGDLGRTMITPANAMRTLKTQVSLLGRSIGQVLTPFVMQAIPYIMALTNVLTQMASALAKTFGYNIADIDYSDLSFEDADEGASNLNKLGAAAAGAGKKAKNSLAPFDELNQVISSTKSSGSGGVGDDLISKGVFDKILPQYDMLKNYNDRFVKQAKDLEGLMKNILGFLGAAGAIGLVVKLYQWTYKVLSIADALKKSVTVIGTRLKTSILSVLPTALIPYFETLLTLLKGIATVLTAIEGVKLTISGIGDLIEGFKRGSSVIEDFINTVKILAGGVISGAAIGSMFGPGGTVVGAIIGGITAISAAMASLIFANQSVAASVSELQRMHHGEILKMITDVENWNKKQADGLSEIWKNRDEALKSVDAYASFSDKLLDIVDANGKIKEGHEGEAKIIVNELNSALGTNIEIRNGEIQAISKVIDNINKLIEKKRAEIKINAYEEAYKKALMNSTDAQKKLNEALYARNEAERNLNTYTGKNRETQKKLKEDYDKSIEAYNNAYDHYREIMVQKYGYEQAYVELIKGNYDKVNDILDKYSEHSIETTRDSIVTQTNMLKGGDLSNDLIDAWYMLAVHSTTEFNNALASISDEKTRNKIIENVNKLIDPSGTAGGYAGTAWGNQFVYDGNKYLSYHKLTPSYETAGGAVIKTLVGHIQDGFNNNPLQPKFLVSNNTLSGIRSGFVNYFNANPLKITSTSGTNYSTGKSSSGGNVCFRETGGFVDSGDFFFANENGRAEFITSIGQKTAVANQDQMVTALTNAILAGMQNIKIGGGQRGDTIVYIGNDKVYQGQGQYQSRQNDRYGTSVVRI